LSEILKALVRRFNELITLARH